MNKKQFFKAVMYKLIYDNPGLVALPLAIAITLFALVIFDVNGPLKAWIYPGQ